LLYRLTVLLPGLLFFFDNSFDLFNAEGPLESIEACFWINREAILNLKEVLSVVEEDLLCLNIGQSIDNEDIVGNTFEREDVGL